LNRTRLHTDTQTENINIKFQATWTPKYTNIVSLDGVYIDFNLTKRYSE